MGKEGKDVFLLPYGFCNMVKLKEYAKERWTLSIESNSSIGIHIEDPMKTELLKLDYVETTGDKLNIELDAQGLFETKHFDLEIEIVDSSIGNGKTCTDYEKSNTSFAKCIDTAVRKLFLERYTCIPPWLYKNSSETCPDNKKSVDKSTKDLIKQDLIYGLITEGSFMNIGNCLQPCKRYNIRSRLILHRQNRQSGGTMSIHNIKVVIKI